MLIIFLWQWFSDLVPSVIFGRARPPHFVPALPPLLWELLSLVEFINCMHDAMEVKASKKKKKGPLACTIENPKIV